MTSYMIGKNAAIVKAGSGEIAPKRAAGQVVSFYVRRMGDRESFPPAPEEKNFRGGIHSVVAFFHRGAYTKTKLGAFRSIRRNLL